MTADAQNYKKQAAAHALSLVEPGMVLGLGTGSTAAEFVRLLAARVKQERLDLRCVATSEHDIADGCRPWGSWWRQGGWSDGFAWYGLIWLSGEGRQRCVGDAVYRSRFETWDGWGTW